MAGPRIYLDYNATSPLRPEACQAVMAAVENYGNASSVHAEGRRARQILETARRDVAALLGAEPDDVTFTSGGTEAANLALAPLRSIGGDQHWDRLIVGATEHAAVLNGHRFAPDKVEIVPVSSSGVVDLERLRAVTASGTPPLVAIQAANNETGARQPIQAIADIVHAQGGLLVCDAVQAAGRIDCRDDARSADIVLLSSHKLGGLAGAGALVAMRGDLRLTPLVRGGGQERGRRAGTENIPALAAFGAAAALSTPCADASRLAAFRDCFEVKLRDIAPEAVIFSAGTERLPNTSAFAIREVTAERLMMALDLGGIAVSSGSACSSGKVGRSHVLEAMGVEPDLRAGAIRVSFGWRSVDSDVDGIIAVLASALARMARRPFRSAA